GGSLSSRLVASGWQPLQSRKILMTLAAILLAIGAILQVASGVWAVLFSLCLCTIGVGMWACNLHALATDAFPRSIVATVHGTAGPAGAGGAHVVNSLVGYFRSRHNYGAAVAMFCMPLPLAGGARLLWLFPRAPAGRIRAADS